MQQAIFQRSSIFSYWRYLLAISGMAVGCSNAYGDGGTLQLSQRYGDLQVSVFTFPSIPRVGLIDVSVLVQDAKTKRIREDIPVTVQLQCIDKTAIPLRQSAVNNVATNRLFKAAEFDVPIAGNWRAVVLLPNEKDISPITLELAVGSPLPSWLQLAPWVSWPFALAILFVIHQKLATRSSH